MLTVTPGSITNTWAVLWPLAANWAAPGPWMVRSLSMTNFPVVSVIVPVTLNKIVSPGRAVAIALRSEPGPLSFVLVTVWVAAQQGAKGVLQFFRSEPGVLCSDNNLRMRARLRFDPAAGFGAFRKRSHINTSSAAGLSRSACG